MILNMSFNAGPQVVLHISGGVLTSSTWQHGLGILRTLRLLRLERDLSLGLVSRPCA